MKCQLLLCIIYIGAKEVKGAGVHGGHNISEGGGGGGLGAGAIVGESRSLSTQRHELSVK